MNQSTLLRKKTNPVIPLIVVAAFLVFPFIFRNSNYVLVVANFIGIYMLAVSGLDVLFGYCGQISLGHAAFYAIGAYGTGIMHNFLGVPTIVAMVISAAVATGVGALLAMPCARLRYHFLALATNAFCNIIFLLCTRSPGAVTGDMRGMFSDKMNLFGIPLDTNFSFYFFLLVVVVLFMLIKTMILNSKVGRALIAIRENSVAADGMGINVRRYKVIAFATSAFFTAFAGGMYLGLVGFISPETFAVKQSVIFLTMLLFGGSSSLLGPLVGAVSAQLMTEALRDFGEYQMLVYGILLILIVLFIPGGIYGWIRSIVNSSKQKKQLKKEAAE